MRRPSFSIILSLLVSTGSIASALPADATGGALSPGEHHAELNGVKLWYLLAGHGPLLVVQAPGWGPGSEYLRNGLKPLQDKFTLLFYDTRGSARSSRPIDPARMTTGDMVDDLEQLRAFLKLDSLSLVGHSHGGTIALGYAISHPERVENLILVDSDVEDYPDEQREANFHHELELRRGDARFASALKAVTQTPSPYRPATDGELDAYLHSVLPLYFFDPVRSGPKFHRTDTGPRASSWAWRSIWDAVAKAPMRQDALLGQIKARTLVLVGRADWICPVKESMHIHEQVRNSQLVVLERAGHFPWIETPEAFFREISRFMEPKRAG